MRLFYSGWQKSPKETLWCGNRQIQELSNVSKTSFHRVFVEVGVGWTLRVTETVSAQAFLLYKMAAASQHSNYNPGHRWYWDLALHFNSPKWSSVNCCFWSQFPVWVIYFGLCRFGTVGIGWGCWWFRTLVSGGIWPCVSHRPPGGCRLCTWGLITCWGEVVRTRGSSRRGLVCWRRTGSFRRV